jgi:hypothetical protein
MANITGYLVTMPSSGGQTNTTNTTSMTTSRDALIFDIGRIVAGAKVATKTLGRASSVDKTAVIRAILDPLAAATAGPSQFSAAAASETASMLSETVSLATDIGADFDFNSSALVRGREERRDCRIERFERPER